MCVFIALACLWQLFVLTWWPRGRQMERCSLGNFLIYYLTCIATFTLCVCIACMLLASLAFFEPTNPIPLRQPRSPIPTPHQRHNLVLSYRQHQIQKSRVWEIEGPDNPTCQLLPISTKQVWKWDGKGRKDKVDGGRQIVGKSCVSQRSRWKSGVCVCDRDVYDRVVCVWILLSHAGASTYSCVNRSLAWNRAGGHGSIHQSAANEATDVWRG